MEVGPVNHVVWSPKCISKMGNQVRVANDIAILPTSKGYVLWLDEFAVK